MNIDAMLSDAQSELQHKRPKNAQSLFLSVWRNAKSSLSQRETALHGYCKALDVRGECHVAETEMMDGQRILARLKRELLERQARPSRRSFADYLPAFFTGGVVGLAAVALFARPSSY